MAKDKRLLRKENMKPVSKRVPLLGATVGVTAITLLAAQTMIFPRAAQADEKALPPLKIVLVGDSTVAPNGGWGNAFAQLLKPQAQCVNLALGGRSSKSYRDEGHWKDVLAQKPDYLFLQFGHNDMPGKGPERETDPQTTYAQNMARYVAEARAIGAKPVLVTSLTRRRFGPDGHIVSDLVPYVEAVKKVASENHVPLVDLNARSIEELNAIGPEAAAQYNRLGTDPTTPDRTHLSEKGAQATALLVAREVQTAVPALVPYFETLPPAQQPK